MNKILLVIALLGIVLVSGCVNPITETVGETFSKIDVTYFSDTCRWDTDCLMTHCRDTDEYFCRNSIQTLREVKCLETGGMISEKNYILCGCFESVCKGK
ncbi:MAG: hypothetical protein KJ697_02805 [Nanoarchaeota archaeon]|nr:hypothetical protein [Nanoarchaeota archaeon]MBU4124561.1 hypothetical protein [Nanoarchaeota archaeon]